MREIPNNMLTALLRYLPLLIDNLDKEALRKSLRLTNAVRVIRHIIIPKLTKIDGNGK